MIMHMLVHHLYKFIKIKFINNGLIYSKNVCSNYADFEFFYIEIPTLKRSNETIHRRQFRSWKVAQLHRRTWYFHRRRNSKNYHSKQWKILIKNFIN